MNRFIGSGRVKEGGQLAVHKSDFNTHVNGGDFRHTANQIDVVKLANLNGTEVQTVLEELNNSVNSGGTGYISIGNIDGYALGKYNVGSEETPTLTDALESAFVDSRLQNGGVILILAGTYYLYDTVIIPAGITIMGESTGSLIIGQMNERPMFIVNYPDPIYNIGGDSGSGETSIFLNYKTTTFSHLMLADNLDGYAASGGPTMVTVPIIQCKSSSDLVLNHVSFFGRLNSGTITGRTKTLSAVSYVAGGGSSSSLRVNDCFFDGLKLGIDFIPTSSFNFLSVKGCKAKIYGTEDASIPDESLNCFINTTYCNVSIVDNFFYATGSQVSTMIAIISDDGNHSNKMVVSGNYGITSGNFGNLVKNLSGASLVMNLNGNYWGQNLDSPWYLVVGGTDNGSPGGDIFGSGAIDIVLSLALNNSFTGTVIVNPGTYTVTGTATSSNNFANIKFIGNKNGKNYPVFNLNLTPSDTDTLGNRPLALGNHLESIQFNSVGHRHSIRPGFHPTSVSGQDAGNSMTVMDCIFINTSLYALPLGNTAWEDSLGNTATTNISVKNCYFLQDGTFTDTTSIVLPPANTVKIDECMITGNGYALSLGTPGYTGLEGYENFSITNCVFDLTGYSITAASALDSNYITIYTSSAFVNIDNCQIYCTTTLADSTPISTSLLDSNTFNKFIYIKGKTININRSLIVGPTQSFEVSSISYALPTVFIEPILSAKITNSQFISGYLPLQVGGASSLSDTSYRDGIIIDSCQFESYSQTVIDFDLNLVNYQYKIPYISITKCNFFSGSAGLYPALHSYATSNYFTVGIIQIYAGECNVFLDQNNLIGSLSTVSGFFNVVGIMVDNYFSPGATDGDMATNTIVTNNSLVTTNNYTSASSIKSAAVLWLCSPVIQVFNNYISMDNQAAISSSFIGCLVLENILTTTGHSICHVSGNTFARKSLAGNNTSLARGYLQITADSATNGFIVDNYFDQATYNGSSTSLLENNSDSTIGWTFQRNKNQTSSAIALFPTGVTSIAYGSLAGSNTLVLDGYVSSSSNILSNLTNTDRVTFSYASGDANSTTEFSWSINVSEILPPDVTITGVSFTYQASAVPSTTKSLVATLKNINGTDTDSITFSDTDAHTSSMTLNYDHNTISGTKDIFSIKATINSSSLLSVYIYAVTFTYRW